MKKSSLNKQMYIFQCLTLYQFGFFLVFAVCLIAVVYRILPDLSGKTTNTNSILQTYMADTFPSNVDSVYLEGIDEPMEEFFNSSMATSFFFSTTQYPPSEHLITTLETNLGALADECEFISTAAIYSSTTNTFIANHVSDDAERDSFLYNMIYNYNSNTLEKSQITGNKFNTFLFCYQDYIVFSKDLTTLSGAPHATMFVILEPTAFSELIYRSNASIPYKMSVFDPHNNLLYSNLGNDPELERDRLSGLLAKNNHVEQAESVSYLYCSSEITKLQYVIKLDLVIMPEAQTNPLFLYGSIVLATLLLSLIMIFLNFLLIRKPSLRIVSVLDISAKFSTVHPLSAISQQIEELKNENMNLQHVVSATSAEVVSHLFASIVTGQSVDSNEAETILRRSAYDFQMNDVYVVGILHQTNQDFIKADSRFKTLNFLSSIFDKFKEKNECNTCAFLYDEKSFLIIVSFPYGTSIAKGKSKIRNLEQMIEEGISFSRLSMTVSFGHMYNSIWDLSFSYSEAFKAMHYKNENMIINDNASIDMPKEISSVTGSEVAAAADQHDQIERRAFQITQLIWRDKSDQALALVDRVLDTIFQNDTAVVQQEYSKQLLNSITGHMLSYPFISDGQLTDVYQYVSSRLSDDPTPMEIKNNMRDVLQILCQDFSDLIKKQRNPYIVATLEYIGENYSNPDLSLEEIADSLKLAPNYLSTLFSKSLGKKLFEYVNEFRLEKSIELLLHTDDSIQDISEKSGFGSSRNYIRIFKKYKDTTPGAYRKQHLGTNL